MVKEITSIKVTRNTHDKLMILKLETNANSVDDAINFAIDKLNEMKDENKNNPKRN